MKKLILIASVILLKSIGFSQDTITTIPVFTSNNGYDAISFEVVATSSINITSISNWWSNGTNTTDIWIKQGPINGTGTLVVNNSNGWYLHQSGRNSALWPGYTATFRKRTKKIIRNDFDVITNKK